MEKKKHVIIGCGTAALAALKQMRKKNAEDDIKLVTMEPHLPYSPTSLPYLISGKIKESEISMVMEDFFDRMKAVWIRGKRVERLDAEKREILYDSHERESYDSLLIATGSEPLFPSIPGLNNEQVLQLRTLDHARELMARMKGSQTAIILGAGLIGMHVAECLAEHGIRVQVVEMLPHILPAYFDRDASGMIQRVLEKHGVTFFTGRRATEVAWKKRSVEVLLENGERLRADLLLVATGVKPRTSFLNGSGIKINDGILVDSEMRTSLQHIFAAGDVASAKSFLTGEHGLNPILPNAAEQGKIAGSNMIGEKKEYEGWLPMNTFNFFGHRAVSVGKSAPAEGDEVVLQEGDGAQAYKKIICRDDRLLGATFLGTDVDAGVFQYLIRKRVEIGSYKERLIEAPREASLWLMREAEKKETISIEE
ncbi:MAG TPA: FAD-dependent oxidoreductase [Syntrophorhabdales bacterium]|nr:FAD-dependent oxidoreductase [Syntrophorhabdales bacterium]